MQRLSLILLLSLSAQYQYGVSAESASLVAGSHPRSHATSSAHGRRELGMSDWWGNLMQGILPHKGHSQQNKSSTQGDGQGDADAVQEGASDSDVDADGTDGSDGWTESNLEYNESGGSYVPPSESLITTAGDHAGIAGAMIAALVAAVAGMALVARRVSLHIAYYTTYTYYHVPSSRCFIYFIKCSYSIIQLCHYHLVQTQARRNEEDDSSVKDRMHDFVEIAEIKNDSPGSYTARV